MEVHGKDHGNNYSILGLLFGWLRKLYRIWGLGFRGFRVSGFRGSRV